MAKAIANIQIKSLFDLATSAQLAIELFTFTGDMPGHNSLRLYYSMLEKKWYASVERPNDLRYGRTAAVVRVSHLLPDRALLLLASELTKFNGAEKLANASQEAASQGK